MLITQEYYNNILRKDLILKVLPTNALEIPELEKLEIRIIFPKIIYDYSRIFEGIIYLEELAGQMPMKKILSIKRVGAQDYEKSVVIFLTLRKEKIFNLFLYFYFALVYYWVESRNVLVFYPRVDSKNKIVQLMNKEFFYFFNMPIEYDDRQYEWNLQFLYFFHNATFDVNVNLLSYFLSHYLPYALFDIKKVKVKEEDQIGED